MQAGVFEFDVKRSFSLEFRLTRIPHTQTQSGVGRGGGYPPGTVAPPEDRWRAAKSPEMIPVTIIQQIRRLIMEETYVSSYTNPRCPVASLMVNLW